MKVNGADHRSIWADPEQGLVWIIDQTRLPHTFATHALANLDDAAEAIRSMQVRGAPLIGATAAHGVALAMTGDAGEENLARACRELLATRPTAVNLRWAIERMRGVLAPLPPDARVDAAWREAQAISDEDVALNHAIGAHGAALLRPLAARLDRPLEIMTHCNAGWLATVDRGTAIAPIYALHDAGVPVHVWVSETRPRNQGLLTAWELREERVPYTLIADNAAGHLLQRGRVDAVIVGADRVTRSGDVCNKIGTYLKALAAREARVPFYVATPSPTIDWTIEDGRSGIPIEERSADEVRLVHGLSARGEACTVRVSGSACAVANPAFDVTPAALVTGLVTERGVCAAEPAAMAALFGRT